jgi:hypothetical protein
MQDQDPVIIVQGTGRVSDFVAYYHNRHLQQIKAAGYGEKSVKDETSRTSTVKAKSDTCRVWRHSWLPPGVKDLPETADEHERMRRADEYDRLVAAQVETMDAIVR